MLHLLYIVTFTGLAVLAVGNLIRSLVTLGMESRRGARPRPVPHPELLNAAGEPIQEPLLVVRAIDLEETRRRLDALYHDDSPPEDGAVGTSL